MEFCNKVKLYISNLFPRNEYTIGQYDFLWSLSFAIIYACAAAKLILSYNTLTLEQKNKPSVKIIYYYYLCFYYWIAKYLKKSYVDFKLRGVLLFNAEYFKKIYLNSKIVAVITLILNLVTIVVLYTLEHEYIDSKTSPCNGLPETICFFGNLGGCIGFAARIFTILSVFGIIGKRILYCFDYQRSMDFLVNTVFGNRVVDVAPAANFILNRIDALNCIALFNEVCPICMEDGTEGNDQFVVLPCTHKYHLECIRVWGTSQNVQRHLCPTCKTDYTEDAIQNQINVEHENENAELLGGEHDNQIYGAV